MVASYKAIMGLAARLPGGRYPRFLILSAWCKQALDRGNSRRAAVLAQELLALARTYPEDWNYGNAFHHGHLTLGHVALAARDVATARAELHAAGRTPGSPQLNSFGPNMKLAQDLLAIGDYEAVLVYFDLCSSFWKMGHERLERWRNDLAENRVPNFGPNLVYWR
jgi:hypothetical protein